LPDLVNEYQRHSKVTRFQVYHRSIEPVEAPAIDYRASTASVAEKLLLHCPDFHINTTYEGFKPSFPDFEVFRYFGSTTFQTFD